MSTCSTATSAACRVRGDGHAGHARRRTGCGSDVAGCCGGAGGGRLERKLRDLEQSWNAYKTGRSGAPPRHRRSRSDTDTGGGSAAASSAVVTGAGPDTSGVLLLPVLRGSPRKLLSSFQQTGSGGGGSSASAGAGVTVGDGKSRVRRYEEDASSVCSVDAAVAIAASSCSCSCKCNVLCCACGCGCGCSSSSSCSGSAASTALFSLRDEAVAAEVRKREEGRWAMGRVGRLVTIAVTGVVVLGAMVAAVLEFGMDDGYAEFLVPT